MKATSVDRLQEYGLCILFELAFPLFPIFLELWISGSMSSRSLTLSTAIYAIAIGNGSRYRFLLGLSILISFVFCVAFGIIVASGQGPVNVEFSAKVILVALFISSLIEKYTVHVSEGKVFWDHKKNE